MIPEQNQVMVVREILGDPSNKFPKPVYPFEIYDIPFKGKNVFHHAVDRTWMDFETGSRAASFDFSAHLPIPKPMAREGMHPHDKSVQPTLRGWTEHTLPPPISVYARLTGPDGFLHTAFWPVRTADTEDAPPESAEYHYAFTHAAHQTQFDFTEHADFGATRVFPGAERALVLTVPGDARAGAPPLKGLWSYRSPETRGELPPEHEGDAAMRAARERLRRPARGHALAQIHVPPSVWKMLSQGVATYAWDEASGRMCAAAEGCSLIYVFDFAQSPRIGTSLVLMTPESAWPDFILVWLADTNGDRMPIPVPYR